MNKFYKRLYQAKQKHEDEFNKLTTLWNKRLIYIGQDGLIQGYEYFLDEIANMYFPPNSKKKYLVGEKSYQLFLTLKENILELEKKSELLEEIFNHQFNKFLNKYKKNPSYYSIDLIVYDESKILTLDDMFNLQIPMRKIFYTQSKSDIQKLLLDSFQEQISEAIYFFYNKESFFMKWKNRGVIFTFRGGELDSIQSIGCVADYFFYGNNYDEYDVATAIDNVLERIYKKNKFYVLTLNHIMMEELLIGFTEGQNIEQLESIVIDNLNNRFYRGSPIRECKKDYETIGKTIYGSKFIHPYFKWSERNIYFEFEDHIEVPRPTFRILSETIQLRVPEPAFRILSETILQFYICSEFFDPTKDFLEDSAFLFEELILIVQALDNIVEKIYQKNVEIIVCLSRFINYGNFNYIVINLVLQGIAIGQDINKMEEIILRNFKNAFIKILNEGWDWDVLSHKLNYGYDLILSINANVLNKYLSDLDSIT